MLAVSEDKGAAQLMGINVNGTIALTFAIGSALAAIAGVLLCYRLSVSGLRTQELCLVSRPSWQQYSAASVLYREQ